MQQSDAKVKCKSISSGTIDKKKRTIGKKYLFFITFAPNFSL